MSDKTTDRISDRCPSCGNQTLFIGSGGWLTCSWLKCKEPGVTRAIEALRSYPSGPKLHGLETQNQTLIEVNQCLRDDIERHHSPDRLHTLGMMAAKFIAHGIRQDGKHRWVDRPVAIEIATKLLAEIEAGEGK